MVDIASEELRIILCELHAQKIYLFEKYSEQINRTIL